MKDLPIREISFRRGLNLIWGVELPEDAGLDLTHPVTLSGHSVGKTTLCRLIRYGLGESNFGNPGAESRIRHTFPGGWVGLELVVEGQEWAVIRPLGRTGDSRAAREAVAQDLFDLEPPENKYKEFMKHLRSAMMSGLQTDTLLNNDRHYDWEHLLAWLTRDQEARFQSLHEWRSPRSASDSLKFQKPKEHALYLIRLILDLIQDAEREAHRKLAEAEKEFLQVEARMAELRREPNYRFNEHERALKQQFFLPPTEILNFDENDMMSHVVMHRMEIEQAIVTSQARIQRLDEEMAEKRVWLASYDEQRRFFRDLIEATKEGTESRQEGRLENETIKKLKELRGAECTYGNIPFSKCTYIQDQLAEASKVVDLQKEREDSRVDSETEQRLQILEQKQRNHEEVVVQLNKLREELSGDLAEKWRLEHELARQRGQLERLANHLEQLKRAKAQIDGQEPNTELERETARAQDLRESIVQKKEELERQQASYEQRLLAIGSIYDDLIKRALSTSYSGALRMPKGELQFYIKEATGLSGEAVETLALVLADVAAMVCSCKGIGHHPRFLLHDSPREADLDRRIYNRYLRSMWDLTQEYGGPDSAPFQYIVTTTSRPPEATEQAIRLKLKAHPPESMLFGRLLTNPPMEETPDVFAEVPST
jgi:hypothetical protein